MNLSPPPDLGPDVEISTAQFAKIIGCSRHRVACMCDEGKLEPIRDWRRNNSRGWYILKRRSAMEIKLGLRFTD